MTRILVTGGSSGIGAATVRLLTERAHEVVFTFCRNEATADTVRKATGATALHYDQAAPDSVAALLAMISGGEFEALVNNAARPAPRRLLTKLDPEEFVGYQADAVRSVLTLSTAFVTRVKQRGSGGAIVNVLSSVTLGVPPAKQASYVTAKYALLGLTRSMAVEFLRSGVRVNAVSPAMTETDFNADLPERFVQELAAGLPMGRLATPAEVAGVIQFLLSPEASYITGANIPIAGGQAC